MSVTINASTSAGLIQTADTSGTVEIQSNGSTKLTIASTGVSGTVVSGTAVSASGTSVDFTGIPSWVKRITVMFNGVSTNGTSVLQIQLGDSGGIETTGYSAMGCQISTSAAGGAVATTGFVIGNDTAAAQTYSGNFTIALLGSNAWTMSGSVYDTASRIKFSSGVKSLSDTLTQVRITTVNGTDTFDAGTINILYEG